MKTLLPEDLFTQLEELVDRAATALFSALRTHVTDESFYGFAFCPDEDVRSFFWMANTEEGLMQSTESWLAEVKRDMPQEKVTLEMGLTAFRFQVPDWKYEDEWHRELDGLKSEARLAYCNATNRVGEIWQAFDELEIDEDDPKYDKAEAAVKKRILSAMVAGLKRFDSEAAWQPAIDRERFTLLVYIPDTDKPSVIREMARQLNPNASYQSFKSQYFEDGDEEQ